MIVNNIRHLILTGSVCCAFAAAVTSCSDWKDHYEAADAANGGNLTLWQLMKNDAQLSDFCQVLEQTKVFRMHKKASVSYADLLNSGQSFTVVAPLNGSFDKEALLQQVQTNQGDSVVEKSFVLNHISRSATSLKPVDQSMLLLNSKHILLQEGNIQGVTVVKGNQHALNGVLHVTSEPLPYTLNLYEALCDMPDMASIGAFLHQYEWDEFDPNESVSSGIVEGVPVYVDSVVYERNRMLESIGLLNDEDSVYWVVAPTAQGWQRAWDATSKFFTYDNSVQKRDSIQKYWTNRALLDDAIFNMTDQKSTQDSLVSVPYFNWRRNYVTGKPIFHVFHQPFAAGGILNGAVPVQCSNGVLYKSQEWPFTPEETFFKELWSEGESTSLIMTDEEKACSYNVRREVADSISGSAYLQILPEKATSNWELPFRVNNTLAGDYDVCVIILPKSVSNQVNPDMRPCKFKATINYVDEQGNSQSFNCGNTQFKSDPLRVDTVVLAQAFHFPVCNYDQNNTKITVKLQCSILARETSSYAREMYLDCIYLRPRTSNAE
jgi:hypothetical protein